MHSSRSHPIHRSRSLTALGVAAVTAVAMMGCSDTGDGAETPDGPPAEVLQDAISKTLEQRAFSIDSDLDLDLAGQVLSLEIEGSVDYDTTVSDITLSVSQGGSDNSVRVLSDGDTLWIDLDSPQAPPFPDDATWLQGETSRLADSTTFTPEGILGAVLILRGAQDVEEIGTDDIAGVAVTRYASTFTYDEAAEAAFDGEAETLQDAFALTGDAAEIELEVEAAVGADGVLREIELDLVEEEGVPASGGYDLELTDVGGDIEAPEPPDPDDVASGPDAEELLDQLIT